MKFKILIFFLACMQLAKSQNFNISGYVEDSKTGERIIGANVIDSISKQGTSTNNYGFYRVMNVHGKVAIRATYLGFKSEARYISLTHDTVINFKIYPVSEMQEVVIESSLYNRSANTPLGLTMIPRKMLTSIPALGEADLLKSIQSQPGIKGGVEGSAGIFVRGGGSGENLFLLDDVPIYNVSHLYGFFSVFNISAVKDVKLLTGCFPARYGGRTSSVIDVRSLDGNNKSLKGELSIGLLSSKLMLEGPLFSDKTTFMVSGRRTYFNLFTEPLKKHGLIDKGFPNYYFYDMNARLAHTFSQKDRIYLSFYNGKDYIQNTNEHDESVGTSETFTENRQETSGWGNLIGSLRWNHTFGNSLFANATFAYSRYDYFIQDQYSSVDDYKLTDEIIKRNYNAGYTSNITDLIAKTDFDYSVSNNHLLRFGAGVTFHTFNPGKNTFNMDDQLINEKIDTTFTNDVIHANEPFFYVEDEMKITPKMTMNAGIRLSGFVSGNSNSLNPEPRLSANYMFLPGLVMKAGYARMVQYMHLLSSSNLSMPTDLWVPAVKGLKPLKSDQINLGLAYDWNKVALISAEVYRKWLYNTTDYLNGASLTTEIVPWYDKVTQGTGNAKGMELSIEKQQGHLTGSIHYTLSVSDRTYADLNNGQTFPFTFDRRHDFNIFVNCKISKKWDVSAMWVYGSGYPVTLPVEKYLPSLGVYNITTAYGDEIDYYPTLNNFRLPAYHRLDLGFHYKNRKHTWSFDIFNVYNRKNPVYMYYSHDYIKKLTTGSLLPIIPSITYTWSIN